MNVPFFDKLKEKCPPFWRKLAKNAGTALFGTTGAAFLDYVSLALTIRTLGVLDYGFFVLAQQYMTIIDNLANFQSWSAVIKFGSDARAAKDKERLLATIKSGYCVDIATALLGVFLAIILVPFVGNLLEWGEELKFAALVFSLTIISHIEGSSVGVLRLFDKFKWTAYQAICSSLFKLCALTIYVFVLKAPGGYLGFACVYVLSDIVKHLSLLIISLVFVSKRFGLQNILGTPFHCLDREFFKFCLWSNLGSSVDVPVKYLDVYIVELVSIEMVGIYKAYKQVLQLFVTLTNPISVALMPQVAELVSHGNEERGYKVVQKIRNLILAILAPLFICMCFFSSPILDFLLGHGFGDNSLLFLTLFLLSIVSISYVGLHPFFLALGKARETSMIAFTANAIYLCVAFVFVGTIGVWAVVLATAIQYAISIASKLVIVRKQLTKSELLESKGEHQHRGVS